MGFLVFARGRGQWAALTRAWGVVSTLVRSAPMGARARPFVSGKVMSGPVQRLRGLRFERGPRAKPNLWAPGQPCTEQVPGASEVL